MDSTLRRIFLSDLHLQSAETRVFSAFVNLLKRESQRADEIYLLGDLVEMWVGDDDDSHLAITLQAALKLASQKTQVYFQHGNRDFLFGDDFCQNSGATWLPDPFLLDDHILLSHGDSFCTDDHAYQEMRSVAARHGRRILYTSHSLSGKSMGRRMREQSKQTNSNKSTQIMDVNRATIRQNRAKTHGADLLIHGHTPTR